MDTRTVIINIFTGVLMGICLFFGIRYLSGIVWKNIYQKGYEAGRYPVEFTHQVISLDKGTWKLVEENDTHYLFMASTTTWVQAIDLPETHLCGDKGCDVSDNTILK